MLSRTLNCITLSSLVLLNLHCICSSCQSISRNKDIMKIGCSLSEVCPHANSVFGNLDPKKVSHIVGCNYSICHVSLFCILNVNSFWNFWYIWKEDHSHGKFIVSEMLMDCPLCTRHCAKHWVHTAEQNRVIVWNVRRHLVSASLVPLCAGCLACLSQLQALDV